MVSNLLKLRFLDLMPTNILLELEDREGVIAHYLQSTPPRLSLERDGVLDTLTLMGLQVLPLSLCAKSSQRH